jgi:translocation and assembly module TamB
MLRRLLKYLLVIPVGLLLLCAGTLTALTASEPGSRWLIRQALVYAPGDLQITGINGRLISGLTLTGLSYRLDQTELAIGHLTLDWRATALLHGTVRVRQLVARDVQYREPPAPADAAPFALPERITLPLAIQLDLAEITALRVDIGSDQTVVDTLTLTGRIGPILGLRIRQLDVKMQDNSLQLSGRAALHQPYAFRCKLRWDSRLPDAVAAGGEAELDGDLHRINVEHTLSRPFHVTSKGSIQLDTALPTFALAGQWQALHWPLSGPAEYASPNGEYNVKGTVDAYDLSLSGPLDVQAVPAMQVHARGHGDRQHIAVDALHIAALGGSLSASGDVVWSPAFTLGLDIEATDINPGLAWPAWPGHLAGKTHLDIASRADSVKVALRKLDLQGTLQDYPLAAQGDLTFDDGIPGSTGLSVSSGNNRLDVSGMLDARSGLRYRLDAPQLSSLLPGVTGRVRADGSVKGPLQHIAGGLNLSATGLAYQENSVQTLNVQAWLDPGRPQTSKISATAHSARLGQTPIDSLTLTGQGWIDKHRASLEVTAEQGTATLRLQGGYREDAWDGKLELATLDSHELGNWRLRDPVALHVTARSARPFKACWQAQQREVCLQGSWDKDTLQLAVSGEAAEGHLRSDITLSQLGSDRLPLSGTVSLTVPDLRFLDSLVPDVRIAGGAVVAEVRLAGYLDAPAISGSASLSNGLTDIPELGVEVKNIGLQAEGKGADIAISGKADSGKGSIRLAGRLSLDPEQGWPFDVTLQGERFAIASLPDMDIQANPDLQLAGSLQLVNITGSVLVPHARITLKKLPPNVVKVSADQVIVGPTATSAEQTPSTVPVSINVVASLGDDVHFEGLGLSTDLAGSINIRSLQTKALIGNGVLELKNGRYEGYGQKLAIQQGRLLFAGPLDNPALDIRATRTIGDVTAGLQLSGNADAPESQLFSNPAMPDADIMSYLVTGKPLSASSSGQDSQALAAAAASLGANNPVSQELSQKLGIDLGVESGATDADTAFKVGKQLSSRLYVDYVYGLFNETAAFQVIYKLTDHLSLTGQSGAQQSIDLKFNIDRK